MWTRKGELQRLMSASHEDGTSPPSPPSGVREPEDIPLSLRSEVVESLSKKEYCRVMGVDETYFEEQQKRESREKGESQAMERSEESP